MKWADNDAGGVGVKPQLMLVKSGHRTSLRGKTGYSGPQLVRCRGDA